MYKKKLIIFIVFEIYYFLIKRKYFFS